MQRRSRKRQKIACLARVCTALDERDRDTDTERDRDTQRDRDSTRDRNRQKDRQTDREWPRNGKENE